MPRLEHKKPGITYACPACDRTTIYERKTTREGTEHPDRPYRCECCGVCLNYVIERPKKNAEGFAELPKQQTLGYENGPRQRKADDLSAYSPEDLGLSPVGVRSGQP